MKIIRLYTGTDSKSHFEEIELNFGGNQPMLTTDSRPATSAVFRCAPAGLVIDRHPAPRLGEHTRELLREAGYDDAAIDKAIAAGAAKEAA